MFEQTMPNATTWKQFKYFHQLDSFYVFKPLEVEVQGIKVVFIAYESELNFCIGLGNQYLTFRWCFLHSFIIIKKIVISPMLFTGLLVHYQFSQILIGIVLWEWWKWILLM